MRIVFMGTPQAAVPTLAGLIDEGHEIAAVYTQPDRPSGRGNKVSFSAVKEFALAAGLNVEQPLKIRTPQAIGEFVSLNADVAVVVAYGRILPDAYLSAFPNGAVNVHFSLLPKYRGAAPVNWAIANGENETGVTTMRMDAGLDTGDILKQAVTRIGPEETSVELMARLSEIGSSLLIDTLKELRSIEPVRQNESEASYAPILQKSNGQIDWSMSATDIANRVRGFQPFPSSFTYLDGKRMVVWNAKSADAEDLATRPGIGSILVTDSGRLIVGCGGDTLVEIEELQPEGKRRMAARDVLNGGLIKGGMTFG